MSDSVEQREEWPRVGRAGRGGKPPTEIQLKIIECLRRWGMPPFGESSSEDELLEHMTDTEHAEYDREHGLDGYYVPDLSVSVLQEELYDAVLAGWVKMTPYGYDTWERPRPERTDLPVEDRERHKQAAEQGGVWRDANGGRHVVSPSGIEMGVEGGGSDEELLDTMKLIDRDQEQRAREPEGT